MSYCGNLVKFVRDTLNRAIAYHLISHSQCLSLGLTLDALTFVDM
jgi:hypothetical protein